MATIFFFNKSNKVKKNVIFISPIKESFPTCGPRNIIMLCYWVKHLKSLQVYCKLKFNFGSNHFGHNSHRHLKRNITPHTNLHHTQADTCAPSTPHKHSKYHYNMNMCTLLSTYNTFTLDFWPKKKKKTMSSSSLSLTHTVRE